MTEDWQEKRNYEKIIHQRMGGITEAKERGTKLKLIFVKEFQLFR